MFDQTGFVDREDNNLSSFVNNCIFVMHECKFEHKLIVSE